MNTTSTDNSISTIHIGGTPKVWFAHIFSAPSYTGLIDLMPNSIELTYIKSGSINCIKKSGEHYSVSAGSVIINTPDHIKRIYAPNFHEHHTFSITFTPATKTNGFPFSFPVVLSDEKCCLEIAKYLDKLLLEYKMNGNSLKTLSLVFKILEIVDTYTNLTKQPDSFGNLRYTNEAKKYIAKNIEKHLCVSEIANIVNITPQYLCNIFKKTTGITIVTYINQLKLDKIKNLVVNKGISLRQAGESVGIEDEHYISRLFKKYYGKNLSALKKYPDWSLQFKQSEFDEK